MSTPLPPLGQDRTSDARLRAAIVSVIALAAPLARAHALWIFSLVTGENANILKSALDNNRIHAYFVTRTAQLIKPIEEQTGLSAPNDSPRFIEAVYLIKAVHYFLYGGETGTNSEDSFTAELWDLIHAFAQKSDLDLSPDVEAHSELQILKQGFQTFGETLCHVADLELTVSFLLQV